MTHATKNSLPAIRKALVYWRKNYLFGVARPAAMVFDGVTLSCVDNDLATVFDGPLSSVTVRKGFGIYKVFVDGTRVAFLTPTGGTPSPAPSAALLQFLQKTSAGSASGGQAGTAAAMATGNAIGGDAGGALGVAGAIGQVFVTANYVKGTKALGEFLVSIGALNAD